LRDLASPERPTLRDRQATGREQPVAAFAAG